MTEEEWLTAITPTPMLEFLREKASDRKLRLYGVACFYLARVYYPDDGNALMLNYPLIDVITQFADGLVGLEEMRARWSAGGFGSSDFSPEQPFEWALDFVGWSELSQHLGTPQGDPKPLELVSPLRDIFGNPFRPTAFAPAWRTDTAMSLAKQMYDSRDFSAMPILADSLQDAGCEEAEILDHCRDANAKHVRGCWVADLVLGKL